MSIKTEVTTMTMAQWIHVLAQLRELGGVVWDGEETLVTHPEHKTSVTARLQDTPEHLPQLVDVEAPMGMLKPKYFVKYN